MRVVIPEGTLPMHAEQSSVNTTVGRETAAATAAKLNTSKYISANFFESPREGVAVVDTPSGGKVSVIRPTGPYSERSFLVTAAGPDSLQREHVDTEQIYSYPLDVQEAYWRLTVNTLIALESVEQPGQVTVATENCIQQRTDERKRTSRTIGLPHIQISQFETSSIVPSQKISLPDLLREQRLILRVTQLSDVLQRLSHEMSQEMGLPLHNILPQENAPFGYWFVVDALSKEDREIDTHNVAATMAAHHRAYARIAEEIVGKLRPHNKELIIPQPSYRLYLTLEPDGLIATISPEIFSPAGVVEAMGVVLHRSPENPRRLTLDEISATQEIVRAALQGTR